MTVVLPRGEPFFFPGGEIGCLLVHGFTGSPDEMRWLGKYLAEQGFSVLGVRLPGHGTDPADLARSRWSDWLASLEDGFQLLSAVSSSVVAIGLSLGSMLCLQLTKDHPVAGVVAISVPHSLSLNWRLRLVRPFLRPLSALMRYYPKEASTGEGHLSYPKYPVRAVAEADALLSAHRASLPAIQTPVLILHSRQDPTIPSEHAERVYRLLGSLEKELRWVEGGHVVVRDRKRSGVFEATAEFVRQVASHA